MAPHLWGNVGATDLPASPCHPMSPTVALDHSFRKYFCCLRGASGRMVTHVILPEQAAVNRWVAGSNPARGANSIGERRPVYGPTPDPFLMGLTR